MGLYSKLFASATERGRVAASKPKPPPSPRERLRQTAADEFQGRTARRAERAEAERPLTPQEQFLAGRYVLTCGTDFQSSNPAKPNVYQVWYVPGSQELFVRYYVNTRGSSRPGPTYRYWTVTEAEAGAAWGASSKGKFVWEEFRVSGSKTAHSKNYALVSG